MTETDNLFNKVAFYSSIYQHWYLRCLKINLTKQGFNFLIIILGYFQADKKVWSWTIILRITKKIN